MSPIVTFIFGLFVGEGLAVLILALCAANNFNRKERDDEYYESN